PEPWSPRGGRCFPPRRLFLLPPLAARPKPEDQEEGGYERDCQHTGGDGRDIADHPHEPRHQEGHDAEAEEDERGGDGGPAILLHARPPEAWLPLHFSAVRPCLNLIATHSFPEDLEPLHLLAIAIEIFRREPEFQGAANRRPFVVKNGIPGRVAV